MLPLHLTKLFATTLVATSVAYVYHIETSPSTFQKAAHELGLNGQKPEALLNIFSIAGYLEKQKLWADINRSKIFSDTHAVFYEVYKIIHDKENDSTSLSKQLFGRSAHYFWETPTITTTQAQDWILYLAQNAFDRKTGQERSELNSHGWMKEHKSEYMLSAKTLGMIDRIDADRSNYDEAWIAGASRPGVLSRAMDYKWILNHGITIDGKTKILAGARPLWAEIDGIHPAVLKQLMDAMAQGIKVDDINVVVPAQPQQDTITNGAEYIQNLAHKLHIPLVKDEPVIKYSTKEICQQGLFPGRTYPNYASPNGPKLDESAMSLDIMELVLGANQIEVVDTHAQDDQRPTTATTALDATQSLIRDINAGKYGEQTEFHVLFQTNNPYIERQTLGAQRAVNFALTKAFLPHISIILHGVGFGCKQDVATIHSELGALIFEKWVTVNPYRTYDKLQFQTRDNDSAVGPLIGDESLLEGSESD